MNPGIEDRRSVWAAAGISRPRARWARRLVCVLGLSAAAAAAPGAESGTAARLGAVGRRQPTEPGRPDSTPPAPLDAVTATGLDSLRQARTDSLAGARLDSLQARLASHSLTRLLSDFVFVQRTLSDSAAAAIVPAEADFMPFRGRRIRRIGIERVGIFGGAPDAEHRGVAGFAEAVHVDTRQRVIAGYLLMRAGDRLDPYALADTERILRATRFILEARIRVVPLPESPDAVDLVVVVQDVWSIGISGSVRNSSSYRLQFFDRNLMGLGSSIEYEIDVDRDRAERVGHRATLSVENLRSSFIRSELELADSGREDRARLGFARSALAPQILWTGGLALSSIERFDDADDPRRISESFGAQDFWLGRAIPLGRNPAGGVGRTLVTLAGRAMRTSFRDRPPVSAGQNRRFHDRTVLLGSVTLSRNDFREGRLILGYGRTEDVPYGYLARLTGGFALGEFDDRPYWGLDVAAGGYSARRGHYAGRARVGGFVRRGRLEDGVLALDAGHFSNLAAFARYRLRQFWAVSYTQGIGREAGDRIELEDLAGTPDFRALNRYAIAGRHRLSFGVEPVIFTPWNFYGFKVAAFGAAGAGAVSDDVGGFLSAKYVPSLGFGFRVHNEQLVFDAFELRLVFLPSPPAGKSMFEVKFNALRILAMRSFVAGAPAVVDYQ